LFATSRATNFVFILDLILLVSEFNAHKKGKNA